MPDLPVVVIHVKDGEVEIRECPPSVTVLIIDFNKETVKWNEPPTQTTEVNNAYAVRK
jgi:hypothetical protein